LLKNSFSALHSQFFKLPSALFNLQHSSRGFLSTFWSESDLDTLLNPWRRLQGELLQAFRFLKRALLGLFLALGLTLAVHASSVEPTASDLKGPVGTTSVDKIQDLQWSQFKERQNTESSASVNLRSSGEGSADNCHKSAWNDWKSSSKAFGELSNQEQIRVIKSMQSFESICLKSAAFYAQLGQWQLLAHEPKDALEALERSLLIDPEQPAVQMDFALALAESGDPVSAKALVDQILLRPDLPVALRSTLEQLKATQNDPLRQQVRGANRDYALIDEEKHLVQLTGSASLKKMGELLDSQWETQRSVQLLVGHDSNLNSASFVNSINLTLPNGTVPLALDSSSLPQSGPTTIGAAQILAQRSIGSQALVLSASWMGRMTPTHSTLGFNNEEFSIQLKPEQDLGLNHRLTVNHFELGGSNFYNGLTYLIWRESALPQNLRLTWVGDLTCRTRLGGEMERRTYAQDSTQNGLFGGLVIGGTCRNSQDQINLGWLGGMDWASNEGRAGGNQRRQELKGSWVHAMPNSKLSLEWTQQWLSDEQIYSDLLGGINRNTLRRSTRLSYQYKITHILGMMVGYPIWVSYWENQRYSSSVELFNLRGETLQTGLKWEF
jgi:hypothetical protein